MVKVYTIGIGGPSCSGKTTITRILRRILKKSVIIYQDDFFKSDEDIPIDEASQLANWDCPEAIDFERFADLIRYTRTHDGVLPQEFNSNEENNLHDGSKLLNDSVAIQLEKILEPFIIDKDAVFVIVDGFMLYWDEQVSSQLDCKITFTGSYELLKLRREARHGYHTPEGDFWADPPGYFEKVVWTEYLKLKEHNDKMKDILAINTVKNSIQDTALLVANKLLQMR